MLNFCPLKAEEKKSPYLPVPPNVETYTDFRERSPFRRTIALSQSLVLTGVARLNGDLVATLTDKETRQTRIITESTDNEGWQLIEIKGQQTDLETLTAQIRVDGGEVVSIRYEKLPPPKRPVISRSTPGGAPAKISSGQEKEAKWAAENYKKGFSSDGYPKEPPPEVVEKLSRIPVQQREAINRHMIGLRNKGLGLDERRKIYDGLLDRAVQGKR